MSDTKTTNTSSDGTTWAPVAPIGVGPAALQDLTAPTPPEEIKERRAYGKGGPLSNPDGSPKMLSYVDARYVQDRLDEVVGPENWGTSFEDCNGGVRCTLSINVAGFGWVDKEDVGVPSNIEPVKGAHSDAFKRAAVQWGIGRDLYEEREPDDAPPTVQQQSGNTRGARYAPRTDDDEQMIAQAEEEEDDEARVPPVCPIHNQHMVVRTGKGKKPPYRAWKGYFCPERGCDTPPQWI